MIPINPVNDAHALLVIAALNEWLQTGFIGGEKDGIGYAIGDGDGDGGNGLSCAPIHWTTDAARHARRS
jgi:hypothetical protein